MVLTIAAEERFLKKALKFTKCPRDLPGSLDGELPPWLQATFLLGSRSGNNIAELECLNCATKSEAASRRRKALTKISGSEPGQKLPIPGKLDLSDGRNPTRCCCIHVKHTYYA